MFLQIGTLLTSLVVKVMTITSLVMATPLIDLFGPTACDTYNLVTTAHNILIVTGGFFMALFRLLCIRFQCYVSSPERSMAKLMWTQFAIVLVSGIIFWWGLETYGSSNFFEFCRGYTTKVRSFCLPIFLKRSKLGKKKISFRWHMFR